MSGVSAPHSDPSDPRAQGQYQLLADRLHDERSARGRLAWAEHAGPGTTRNRVEPIDLAREHVVVWRDYSVVGGHRFRWCAVPIHR